MFKALCKGVRKHSILVYIMLIVLSNILFVYIMQNVVGYEFESKSVDTTVVIITAELYFLVGYIHLCSLLIHCADAIDYIEQHPWVDKDEAWIKTRPSCWNIDDDYF